MSNYIQQFSYTSYLYSDLQFYIMADDGNYLTLEYDCNTARHIGLTEEEYKDIMLNKFNGCIDKDSGEVYFITANDVGKAVDFINVAYKLRTK